MSKAQPAPLCFRWNSARASASCTIVTLCSKIGSIAGCASSIAASLTFRRRADAISVETSRARSASPIFCSRVGSGQLLSPRRYAFQVLPVGSAIPNNCSIAFAFKPPARMVAGSRFDPGLLAAACVRQCASTALTNCRVNSACALNDSTVFLGRPIGHKKPIVSILRPIISLHFCNMCVLALFYKH